MVLYATCCGSATYATPNSSQIACAPLNTSRPTSFSGCRLCRCGRRGEHGKHGHVWLCASHVNVAYTRMHATCKQSGNSDTPRLLRRLPRCQLALQCSVHQLAAACTNWHTDTSPTHLDVVAIEVVEEARQPAHHDLEQGTGWLGIHVKVVAGHVGAERHVLAVR